MKWLLLLLLPLVVTVGASGQTLALQRAIEAAMKDPSAKKLDHEVRGNSAALTAAKQRLREWVESRLARLGETESKKHFEQRLNRELEVAGLFCDKPGRRVPACGDEEETAGGMLPLEVKAIGNWLLEVTTSFRIQVCGVDQSVYLYRRVGARWERVLGHEERHDGKRYRPKQLSMATSRMDSKDSTEPYLVVVMGRRDWCTSAWHPNYVSIYRVTPERGAELVLDEVFGASFELPPVGRESGESVLVEFRKSALEAGMSYPSIHRWTWDGKRMVRRHPYAYKPRDFVAEWLRNGWGEVKDWTESSGREEAQRWHLKLHDEQPRGDNLGPPKRCTSQTDVWQIAHQMGEPGAPVYFRVQWVPPYRFRMLGVSAVAAEDCKVPDAEADDELHSLFPPREEP